jgi:hypothetical protein
VIHKCTCKHEYQDETYGKGMRVFNKMKEKGPGELRYRCTVCKHELSLSGGAKEK